MSTQNELKTVYLLTDVDIEKRTGTLIIRKQRSKKTTELSVDISGKLAYRIKKQREDDQRMKYENVEFTSTMLSKDFAENN